MTSGILVVNKPQGITSRDVVNKVSKVLKTKKIGHTGTLDPIATGVLVLTIEKATKLSEVITSETKEYIAEAILGIESDTLDITGNILKQENTYFKEEEIKTIFSSFLGKYSQEVPIYSAVKINGKKLYEYARNNEVIDLPSRIVNIIELKLLDLRYENNQTIIKFQTLVSKGTYIRSLIRDIASKLNTVGVMKSLIRTKQGNYKIEDSYSLENIQNEQFQIISLEEVLKDYYTVIMDEELERKVKNGCILEDIYHKEYVLFKSDNILALYKQENKIIKPFKMFL